MKDNEGKDTDIFGFVSGEPVEFNIVQIGKAFMFDLKNTEKKASNEGVGANLLSDFQFRTLPVSDDSWKYILSQTETNFNSVKEILQGLGDNNYIQSAMIRYNENTTFENLRDVGCIQSDSLNLSSFAEKYWTYSESKDLQCSTLSEENTGAGSCNFDEPNKCDFLTSSDASIIFGEGGQCLSGFNNSFGCTFTRVTDEDGHLGEGLFDPITDETYLKEYQCAPSATLSPTLAPTYYSNYYSDIPTASPTFSPEPLQPAPSEYCKSVVDTLNNQHNLVKTIFVNTTTVSGESYGIWKREIKTQDFVNIWTQKQCDLQSTCTAGRGYYHPKTGECTGWGGTFGEDATDDDDPQDQDAFCWGNMWTHPFDPINVGPSPPCMQCLFRKTFASEFIESEYAYSAGFCLRDPPILPELRYLDDGSYTGII